MPKSFQSDAGLQIGDTITMKIDILDLTETQVNYYNEFYLEPGMRPVRFQD